MNIILEGIDPSVLVRSHPYDSAKYDSRVKHYDFVKHPELIRKVLEDFKPWERYESIESFYQLLEWTNGSESIFESSDCRLESPKKNPNKNMPYDLVLQGRVMIFFRDIKLNYADIDGKNYWVNSQLTSLATDVTEYLKKLHPEIWWITIQLFFFPAKYRQEAGSPILGQQIAFQFNCFGNEESELFEAFRIFTTSILKAFKQVGNQ